MTDLSKNDELSEDMIGNKLRLEALLSVAEALQVMLGFGSFIIALLKLVIAIILLNNKKK